MEPEVIADYACEVGEGPLWHPMEKQVYWVDIPAGRLFRYDPATGRHEKYFEADAIGGFTVQADGSLLLFMGRGRVAVLRDGSLTDVVDGMPGEEHRRFNDVIADPAGRVFCGTMPVEQAPNRSLGKLYRLEIDGSFAEVLSDIGTPNGMGFTPNRRQMYFTDTRKGIDVFDYDQSTGEITNRRPLVSASDADGGPDGMTVDSDGNLWSARWGGYAVRGYSSEGEPLRKVSFPTGDVSSVTFGGEDYTDMYVTTASGHEKASKGPQAGALFRVNIGVKGVPEFLSRVAT